MSKRINETRLSFLAVQQEEGRVEELEIRRWQRDEKRTEALF